MLAFLQFLNVFPPFHPLLRYINICHYEATTNLYNCLLLFLGTFWCQRFHPHWFQGVGVSLWCLHTYPMGQCGKGSHKVLKNLVNVIRPASSSLCISLSICPSRPPPLLIQHSLGSHPLGPALVWQVDQMRSPRWRILDTLVSFSPRAGVSCECFLSLWLRGDSWLSLAWGWQMQPPGPSLHAPWETGMGLLSWFWSLLLVLLSRNGSLPPALLLRMDSCKSFMEIHLLSAGPEPLAERKSVSGSDSLFLATVPSLWPRCQWAEPCCLSTCGKSHLSLGSPRP